MAGHGFQTRSKMGRLRVTGGIGSSFHIWAGMGVVKAWQKNQRN